MTRATSILAAALAALIGLTAHAQAQAVPGEMSFTARISDGNGPVTGALNLKFEIFTDATAGTSQWEEMQTGIIATDGMLYAMIGANNPLNASILDGGPLFLEVTVGSDTMSPRIALASVPYAIRADTAAVAESLGDLGPGDVLPKGSTLACANATTQKVTGINPTTGDVVCGTDQNTTYTAGTGLSASGTTFNVIYGGSGTNNSAARSNHTHGLSCSTVTDTATLPASSNSTTVSVDCTSGVMTGGGCRSLNTSVGLVTASYAATQSRWRCYFRNYTQTETTIYAYARCCTVQ